MIGLALSLAQFAPQIVGWITGSKNAEGVAQKALDIAEAITGKSGADAVSAISNDPQLSMQYQQAVMANELEFARIASESDKIATEATTSRWLADMSSDNRLSKNIRPAVLIYLLIVYTAFAVAAAYGVTVPEAYVTLLGQWGMLVMTAYFGGRSAEKIAEIVKR